MRWGVVIVNCTPEKKQNYVVCRVSERIVYYHRAAIGTCYESYGRNYLDEFPFYFWPFGLLKIPLLSKMVDQQGQGNDTEQRAAVIKCKAFTS